MYLTRLLTAITLLGTLTTNSTAETPNPASKACNKALKACDDAIKSAKQVIEDKNAIIKLESKEVQILIDRNLELQNQRDSILRNPVVWFLVGSVIGGLSYGLVKGSR